MRKILGVLLIFSVVIPLGLGRAEARDIFIFSMARSAQIDQSGDASIRNAAKLAKQPGTGILMVTGFAATAGTAKATALLSTTRAQVVVDQLVEDGVPLKRIRMDSKGSTGFADMAVQSHRVTSAFLFLGKNIAHGNYADPLSLPPGRIVAADHENGPPL